MTDKYTIRDILVYTTVGIVGFIFLYINDYTFFINYVNKLKNFSDLSLFLLVPISYVFGHIILTLDCLIFNFFLEIPLRYKIIKEDTFLYKFYNNLIFGNRNMGIRRALKIDNDKFLKSCDKLLFEKNYDKAEYYQVVSDLCKGLFLISIANLFICLYSYNTNIIVVILPLLFWYRGREFSSYYVKMINRNLIK